MCKKGIIIGLLMLTIIWNASAYTLISATNITTSASHTSWYFNPTVKVNTLWQDDTGINATNLYLNYTLLRDGVTNVSKSDDYENISVSDGGNYTFNETCTPLWVNITGEWENTTTCNESGQWEVIRYITEYDSNACPGSTNTTYNETNTTACSYCWPLNTTLTLGQIFNLSTDCFVNYSWDNNTLGAYLSDNIRHRGYEANKMLLGSIVLVPMLLAFLLVIIGMNMSDEHLMFKTFLYLLTFPLFFMSMYLGVTMVGEYLENASVIGHSISIVVFSVGFMFFVVLAYYMMWLTKLVMELMNKGDD